MLICYLPLIGLTLSDTSKPDGSGTVYGGKGTFLSSLARLSLLTITSHHKSYNSLASLSLHHSGAVTRLVPAPAHHQLSNREHGTRITVQELFGNIPVRIKQRTIMYSNKEHEKDWEALNNNIVGLLLAWNKPLVLTVGRPGSASKLCFRLGEPCLNIPPQSLAFPRSVDLSLIRNVLSQAKYIEPPGWSEWVEISIHTDSVAIQGAISLRPAPSKYVQFISLGIHYIHPDVHNILYDLINQIFSGSDFGKEEELPRYEENNLGVINGRFEQRGVKNKQLRRGGTRADRWPMFCIHMDLRTQLKQGSRSAFASLEMEHTFSNISNALEAMILKFLTNHYFRPCKLRKRKCSLIAGLSKGDNQQNKSMCNGKHDTTLSNLSAMGTHSSLPECRQKNLPPSLGTLAALTFESRAAVTAQALGRKINLPSFSRPDYSLRKAFSHCTRIRSGRAGGQLEFMSRPKSKNRQHRRFQTCQLTEAELISSTTNPNHHVKDTQNVSSAIEAKEEDDASTNLFSVDINHNLESENSTFADRNRSVGDTLALPYSASRASILNSARASQVIPGLSQEPRSHARSYSQQMQNFDAVALQDTHSHTSSAQLSIFKTESWVIDFLKSWKNPVFSYSQQKIPDVDIDGHHTLFTNPRSDLDIQKFVSESSTWFSATLSKKALRDAHVIAQVERKFILIRMRLYTQEELLNSGALVSEQVLVLVDQHAADERVRIEGLLSDLCTQPRLRDKVTLPCVHPVSRVETTVLARSIVFEIQEREYALFTTHAARFADWGILYNLRMPHAKDAAEISPGYTLAIKTLPGGIAERCRMDTKALIELMRREVWRHEDSGNKEYNFSETTHTSGMVMDTEPSAELGSDHWHRRIINCPQGILDLLTSRSCRSAIMFNDELTHEECLTLIARLAACIFPFQCAHGRPSMIPVIKLGQTCAQHDENEAGAMENRDFGRSRMTERKFSQAWKRWKQQMARDKDDLIDQPKEASQNSGILLRQVSD